MEISQFFQHCLVKSITVSSSSCSYHIAKCRFSYVYISKTYNESYRVSHLIADYISQGSVAPRLRRDGILNDHLITDLLQRNISERI